MFVPYASEICTKSYGPKRVDAISEDVSEAEIMFNAELFI